MSKNWVVSTVLADWRRALADADEPSAELINEIDNFLGASPVQADLPAFVDLLERAGRSVRQPGFAWATGQGTRCFFSGDFGRVILGCKTLGAALYWLQHFSPLIQDATSMKLDVREDFATLSYKILDPGIWPRHEDAMYSLGIASKLIRAAAPEAWNHVQVTFEAERIRPDLSSAIQTEVVCGCSTNAIRLPTTVLDAPLRLAPTADPAILKRLSGELTRKYRAIPVSERTRLMIFNEMNEGCISQDHIARELGISSRTLRRRLSSENLSYQALLDECRMQFAALEFRTRRKLSLSEMALRLGYSEHSTFSRAFSRWAGMAPQEYRRSVAVH